MNNYKLVTEIGRGSYGQALLCINKQDSQKVGLNVIVILQYTVHSLLSFRYLFSSIRVADFVRNRAILIAR